MLTLKNKTAQLAIDIDLFKAVLGLEKENPEFDKHLERLIRVATEQVEEYTQRSITFKTWIYTHTNHILYLPRPIIQNILEVKADGKTISKDEYKIGYTRDTKVIIIDEKYMDCENSVMYEAGYVQETDSHEADFIQGQEKKYIHCIPDILNNVIFDYAKALFNKGLGIDNKTNDQIINSLSRTSYMPRFYMSEKIKQEAKNEAIVN